LFVYNRLDHVQRTVAALQANHLASQTDVIVFSDAARSPEGQSAVQSVRDYVKGLSGFHSLEVVARERNFGLAASIIDGVTRLCSERGRVIVLEDDLVTAPHFLDYMNDALDFYAQNERVIAVHGYMFPVTGDLPETFFLGDPGCWGWATWKRGWDLLNTDGAAQLAAIRSQGRQREFNLDGSYDYTGMLEGRIAGRNQSWAVLWYATAFLAGKLTLYPGKSLVRNIGFDGSGTHGGHVNSFAVALHQQRVKVLDIPIEENQKARAALVAFLMPLRQPRGVLASVRRTLHRLTGAFQ
jgi:hypothetical protein